MRKKIVIAGGTGFIGRALSAHFLAQNYAVTVFTRGKTEQLNGICLVHWDAQSLGEWQDELNESELLINLTGKSVNCRYTAKNKQQILASRVDSTRVLGAALLELKHPPKLWLNASTATIYDYSLTKEMTEDDGDIGNDFSMHVAQAWEEAFFETEHSNTRKIALRISLVLGKEAGVLPVLTRLTKLGLGGFHGNGKQKFAWIHMKDLLGMVDFIQNHDQLKGPINCTSPSRINNRDFMKALRQSLNVSVGLPTPRFVLALGALLMGTESELILKSRFVSPKKILAAGYSFLFTDINRALLDLK